MLCLSVILLKWSGTQVNLQESVAEITPKIEDRKTNGVIIQRETSSVWRRGSALSGSPLFSDVTSDLMNNIESVDLPRSYPWLIEAGAQFAGRYQEEDIFFAVCGMEILAGYAGLVTEVGEPEDWNDGKGGFVTIEITDALRKITHSNLETINVKVGDFVEKRQIIGTAGNSGHLLSYGVCQIGITN